MKPEAPIETHPFLPFVPEGMQCFILGSFPGRVHTQGEPGPEGWFYGARRNQFWSILEEVYHRPLQVKAQKQALFVEAKIGIGDLIKSARRRADSNLDKDLQILEFNEEAIWEILEKHGPLVLFTSRFVEGLFRKLFPRYAKTGILPSPSPLYYRINKEQKAALYKEMLPRL